MQAKNLPNGYFCYTNDKTRCGIKHNNNLYFDTSRSCIIDAEVCLQDYQSIPPSLDVYHKTKDFLEKELYKPMITMTEVLKAFPKLKDAAEREYPEQNGYVIASTLPDFTVVKVHNSSGYYDVKIGSDVISVGANIRHPSTVLVKPV